MNAPGLPPHFPETERAILACMLSEPVAARAAVETLAPADFYTPQHAALFGLFADLFRDHGNVDLRLADAEARRRGLKLLDMQRIGDLLQDTFTPANVEQYCKLITDAAQTRALLTVHERARQRLHAGECPNFVTAEVLKEVEGIQARAAHAAQGELAGLPVWTLADLATGQDFPFVWDGYLARGCVTLLHSPPKVGKSYLTFALLAKLVEGNPFLERGTIKTGCIYLSEEGKDTLEQKQDTFRLPKVAALPFLFLSRREKQFARMPLEKALQVAVALAKKQGAGLIVVDTLGAWSGLKGEQENNAAFVEELFVHIKAAASEADAAILVLHHSQKNGERPRGSSALEAAVDASVMLGKPKDAKAQRFLSGIGRFPTMPDHLEFELAQDQGEYRLVNKSADFARIHAGILKHIPAEPPGTTRADLITVTGLSRRKVDTALTDLNGVGEIVRAGTGKNKDPFQFCRPFQPQDTPMSGKVGTVEQPQASQEVNPSKAGRNGSGGPEQSMMVWTSPKNTPADLATIAAFDAQRESPETPESEATP